MEECRRWEDNIKMDLKEIGVNVRSWIDSAQDRDYWRALVNAAFRFVELYTFRPVLCIIVSSIRCYQHSSFLSLLLSDNLCHKNLILQFPKPHIHSL